MATEILAVGTTAANSADLVIADGDVVGVCLKGPPQSSTFYPQPSTVYVELKDDGGNYVLVGALTSASNASMAAALTVPGTYRFTRVAGSNCGVFSA